MCTLCTLLYIQSSQFTFQGDIPCRTEQKDQLIEADSNKHCKYKRKHNYKQGEPEPWEWVLRAVNDLKSKVSGFSKLLVEHVILHEDPPFRSNQKGAAGKENLRDPKSKNQR